jgi:hypothetical protein
MDPETSVVQRIIPLQYNPRQAHPHPAGTGYRRRRRRPLRGAAPYGTADRDDQLESEILQQDNMISRRIPPMDLKDSSITKEPFYTRQTPMPNHKLCQSQVRTPVRKYKGGTK